MKKRLAAIAVVALALPGCGGDDGAKESVDAATLKRTGLAWRKLTPAQKKTVVAYCLPPEVVDVSPTGVAAAINRRYRGASTGAGPKIGVACTQAVKGLRAGARARNRKMGKRVARASKMLLLSCPDDPQFLQPKKVTQLTDQLVIAYEKSPNVAMDRTYLEGAVAKLNAGCGSSTRLQQALQKTSAGKRTEKADAGGARTLTGNGPKELGDLAIPRNSDLRWMRDDGAGYFSVTEEQGRLSFLSEAARGYRGVPAGKYRDVWVDTDVPWTIVITPRYPSTSGS